MACQIKRNSNGTITQVLAPNGKDSILYQDLVANLSNPQMMAVVTQDPYVNMVLGTEYIKGTSVEEVALAAWSKAYTADFIEQFGNWKVKTIANTDVNGEPSVDALFPDLKVSNVKPGVAELFESNPELANAVYEALGFKPIIDKKFSIVKNSNLYKELESGINSYEINYNGRTIGKIAVFDSGKNITIKGLEFNQVERNKGLGKAFYKWLNNEANKKGGVLWGDPEQISPDAYRVWESLSKEGLVDITKSTPRFLETQITPQQKQQAQQLYSNYLDTIFPESKVKDIVYHGTDAKFDKFDLKYFGKNDQGDRGYGIYLSPRKKVSKNFYGNTIITAIVNIKNPFLVQESFKGSGVEFYYNRKLKNNPFLEQLNEILIDISKPLDKHNFNTLKFIDFKGDVNNELEVKSYLTNYYKDRIDTLKKDIEDYNNLQTFDGIVVDDFEIVTQPEQIHILGGKQDVEGFKKFVSGGQLPSTVDNIINMKRWTQTKNNCPKL